MPGVTLLVVVLGLAIALTHHRFLSGDNLSALGNQVGMTSMIALGQMIVLGAGGMDLSLGAIGGLSGIVLGWALVVAHLPLAVSVALAMAFGLFCGFVNGWFINRLQYSAATAFVVTLGSGTFYTGVTLGVTKAIPYYNLPSGLGGLAGNAFGSVPWVLIVMLAVGGVVLAVYAHSAYGLRNLAVGGGAFVARLCGIKVQRVVIVSFALAGLFAAMAAVFYTASFGAAQPTLGADWLLPSFAAPILGGTSLSGGRVSIVGTILGALFLAEVTDALIFLHVSTFWNTFFQGAAILFAVSLDAARHHFAAQIAARRARALKR